MKKIGIVGGLAWPSTVEYYAGLCRLAEARHAANGRAGIAAMPEIVIESLDVATAVRLLGRSGDEDSWAAFDAYHRAALQRLERSGAEFGIIACNTAHHRFAPITRGICMPVLNIVDVAARACTQLGMRRVLVLGTETVMQSAVICAAFVQRGIAAGSPQGKRQQHLIASTIASLREGHIGSAPECIRSVVATTAFGQLRATTAVYLGCTELPLAFPAYKHVGVFEADGIRYVNSAALHIQAAFELAVSPAATGVPPAALRHTGQSGLAADLRDHSGQESVRDVPPSLKPPTGHRDAGRRLLHARPPRALPGVAKSCES